MKTGSAAMKTVLVAATSLLALTAVRLQAAEVQPQLELAQRATWKNPTATEVRTQALAWLKQKNADPATVAQVEKLWADVASAPAAAPPVEVKAAEPEPVADKPADEKAPDPQPADAKPAEVAAKPAAEVTLSVDEIFGRLAATFALGDPEARPLVELCSKPRAVLVPPSFAWLKDEKTPVFERNNLRLLYGRWMAQERLYDEAFVELDGLKAEEVVDPASLLFYQAVVNQRMLKRDAGLEALGRLLEPGHELPRRYTSLARLMQADLGGLKDESLDHIARRMDDITRRLDLGRGGPKTREVEDGVIKSLDKLIDEIEKQQQAAAAAMAQAGGTIRSSIPAQDSVPMGGKAPGNVTPKEIGNSSGWGDLPEKQRHEAMQQLGKDYPSHYRDMIEQYFRKLASDNSDK